MREGVCGRPTWGGFRNICFAVLILVFSVVTGAEATPPVPDRIYCVSSVMQKYTTDLTTLNPLSGTGELVGDTGQQAPAAAFDTDGTLYTIINPFMPEMGPQLATVDLDTGLATPVGSKMTDIYAPLVALEIDANGNVYAGAFDGNFYRIDKTTGLATLINAGGSVRDVMDYAFDSSGVLWATAMNILYVIDPATGDILHQVEITGVPATGDPMESVMGIMFDSADNLYATNWTWSAPGSLFRIDRATGAADLVGSSGLFGLHGGDIFVPGGCVDSDLDAVCDSVDVCPGGDDRADSDLDLIPDGCDPCPVDAENDADGDGLCASADNCPAVWNPYQSDTDGDGAGDLCDPEPGNSAALCTTAEMVWYLDGMEIRRDPNCSSGLTGTSGYCYSFTADQCPAYRCQTGTEISPACYSVEDCRAVCGGACISVPDMRAVCGGAVDSDGDGVPDSSDICGGFDDSADSDADLIPDGCDPCPVDAENDADGDGVCGDVDACPGANDGMNRDADLLPDSCDICPDDPANDADGDGICAPADNCPLVSNAGQADIDGDGAGDACDPDVDGDSAPNAEDNCPFDPNPAQADFDGDGTGDACDSDYDSDGVLDSADACLPTEAGQNVNASGCSVPQICPCGHSAGSGTWKNHGAYVSCVAQASEAFVLEGFMTLSEKDAVVLNAAQSSCGAKK